MLVLSVVFTFMGICWGTFAPEEPTVEGCMFRNISMTDSNWKDVLFYYKGCRTLGLEMGNLVPPRFMSRLSKTLKALNTEFISKTKFGRPKIKYIEREFNDLYKEICLLSPKTDSRGGPDSGQCPTEGTTPTSNEAETPRSQPKSKDYGGQEIYREDDFDGPEFFEPGTLFGFLLLVTCVMLVVTACTCRYVRRIHKYVELAPQGGS